MATGWMVVAEEEEALETVEEALETVEEAEAICEERKKVCWLGSKRLMLLQFHSVFSDSSLSSDISVYSDFSSMTKS